MRTAAPASFKAFSGSSSSACSKPSVARMATFFLASLAFIHKKLRPPIDRRLCDSRRSRFQEMLPVQNGGLVEVMRGRCRHLLNEQRHNLAGFDLNHAIDFLQDAVDFEEAFF